jgi:hypothetical protein
MHTSVITVAIQCFKRNADTLWQALGNTVALNHCTVTMSRLTSSYILEI